MYINKHYKFEQNHRILFDIGMDYYIVKYFVFIFIINERNKISMSLLRIIFTKLRVDFSMIYFTLLWTYFWIIIDYFILFLCFVSIILIKYFFNNLLLIDFEYKVVNSFFLIDYENQILNYNPGI